jgi:hypothetical protein
MLIVQMILISAKFRTKASLINKQASKHCLIGGFKKNCFLNHPSDKTGKGQTLRFKNYVTKIVSDGRE